MRRERLDTIVLRDGENTDYLGIVTVWSRVIVSTVPASAIFDEALRRRSSRHLPAYEPAEMPLLQ